MPATHPWTLMIVLATASTLPAQPPASRSTDNNQRLSVQQTGETSGQSGSRETNAQTGRGLEVERGSIPRLFSQERSRSNSTGQNGQNQRSSGRRSRTAGSQTEFIRNALRFDTNSDKQLAANELANLFHVLASSQQASTSVTQPQRTSTTSTSTQSTTTTNSNVQADANFIQRDSVRQALILFLQLALQFDANGDGLLSQPELFNLASGLLANDLSLLNAATQSAGQRSTTTSTSRNSVQTTTTTANQNIRPGQTSRVPQSEKQRSSTRNRKIRGEGSQTSNRPDRDPRPDTESNNRPRPSGDRQNAQ